MPAVTIYHNPRCSKSRQTLEIIQQQQIEPTIIEYLKTPPTPTELKKLLTLLKLKPLELIRRKETVFKSLGLSEPHRTDNDLIKAMCEHPILIERPIVVCNGKAVLGRPPENVLEIL